MYSGPFPETDQALILTQNHNFRFPSRLRRMTHYNMHCLNIVFRIWYVDRNHKLIVYKFIYFSDIYPYIPNVLEINKYDNN